MFSKILLKSLVIVASLSVFAVLTSCSSENEEVAVVEVKDKGTSVAPDNNAEANIVFIIKEARWDVKSEDENSQLKVKGRGIDGELITVVNARNENQVIGTGVVERNRWRINKLEKRDLATVPCRLRAIRPSGEFVELDVKDAPEDCDVSYK